MSVFILENVNKTFVENKHSTRVLKNINISFPDKGLVSIVGKSGSGKSTLLNLLMGIEKPTSGKIYFKYKNIAKFNDKRFSSYHLNDVSLVFQHYNLFDDISAFENVALPLRMRGEKEKTIRCKVNELFKRFHLENLSEKRVEKLSGGEKQRVAILRSLITDPDAILCDEPTGALDYKNSREIMGILKEISDRILIIVISHNTNLVNRFSDKIIKIKDGEIVDILSKLNDTFTTKYSVKKTTYSSRWSNRFLHHNLRINLFKNLFSILACSIGFCAMFVAAGFSVGSKLSQDNALTTNLGIGLMTASKSELIEIEDSPLAYEKISRPQPSLIDESFSEFTTIRYEENVSYLVSNYPTIFYGENIINDFQMLPVYDLSLTNYGSELLIRGNTGENNFDEVIVNEEFANLFGEDILEKKIRYKNSCDLTYKTLDEENPFIKDQLVIDRELKVVGIVKEFPFLNGPKVYYSYQGCKTFLKNIKIENFSSFKNENISYFSYLETCNDDDQACNYSSYLFLEDLDELDLVFKRIKELNNSSIKVTSAVLDIKETYSTFMSSFSNTLIVFVAIAFVGVNLILGMISLSTFINNRKKTAILTCLGAKTTSLYDIYLKENYIVIAISFCLSLILANLCQIFLNFYIEKKYTLKALIAIPFGSFVDVKFGLVLFVFSIAIIFSTVFTLTPMIIYRHKSITDELRDE